MIVVDASALSAFLLKEPGWRTISRYIARSTSVDLVVKEAANAVWKAHMRGLVDRGAALKLLEILLSLVERNIELEPEAAYLPDAFRLALDLRITVYDALYIAQALRRRAPLLTLDERQAEAAARSGVDVISRDAPP
ncbi:MAG: type II toxin-antitoxin system VapC family toxin [Thermoproteus sp.]